MSMLLAMLALGGVQEPQVDCNKAWSQSQTVMTMCAVRAFRRMDAEMTQQWKVTYAFMKRQDAADTSRGGGPGHAATLLESQRAWLRYRDMHCSVVSLEMAGGTAQPMLLSQCKTQLTNGRISELKGLVWKR